MLQVRGILTILLNAKNYVIGKLYTYTVERTNRLLRHYLARFARKTYCVYKSFPMIIYSIYLSCFKHFLPSITFFCTAPKSSILLKIFHIRGRRINVGEGDATLLFTKYMLNDSITRHRCCGLFCYLCDFIVLLHFTCICLSVPII